ANLGQDHKLALFSATLLARAYLQQGGASAASATPLLEDAVTRARVLFTADHPTALFFQHELATAYLKGGRPAAAVAVLEDALPRSRKLRGEDQHPANLAMRVSLIEGLFAAGRPKDGVRLLDEEYRETLAITKNHDALPSRAVQGKLIRLCGQAGYPQGVVEFYQTIVADLRKHLPAGHIGFASWLDVIGDHLLKQAKWEEAEAVLGECHAIRTKHRPDRWDTFKTQALLGAAMLGQKKYEEAEPLLVGGYEGMVKHEKSMPKPIVGGPSPKLLARRPEAVDRIIDLYTAIDKPDEVKKWKAVRETYPNPTPPEAKK
ncbi:MAG: tetratricopeptide repeat protein, partial [Gemmataceae bacterium]